MPAGAGVMKYERVEMFYHRNPDVVTKFVSLYSDRNEAMVAHAVGTYSIPPKRER